MTFHLSAAILETSARRPRSIAIVAPDRVIDYGMFGRAVVDFAAGLLAAGVRPGDAVGLLVTDVPEDLIALFALYRLGAPAIVTSRWETVGERQALLRRIDARFSIDPSISRRRRHPLSRP